MSPIITFEHMSMTFGSTVVHRDISFDISKGETVTILGPSGAGKTVIFRLIIGLLFATSGRVNVLGKDMNSCSEEDLLEVRRRVGILFQGAALFDSLTVFENVAYPLREKGGFSEQEIAKVVEERLELVGLSHFMTRYPSQLSGGQKKRIGLARALSSNPEVVLFDEPTTGLDPTAVRMIDELIIRLREELGITSLVVTHDIASARQISTRWILVANGYKIADGTPAEVEKESEMVRDFVTGYADD